MPAGDGNTREEDRTVLAIAGCALVDVATGQCRSDMTVIVRGERIAAVGPSPSLELPADAQVVNGAGAWVMPGLVDMHVHIGAWDFPREILPLYLAGGVTTIRDCGGTLTELLLLRDELASGRRVGPRLLFAGPLLDGMPPVWPDHALLVDTPERAAGAVPFLHGQGVDFVKIYNNVPESSLRTVVEMAHAVGLSVAGHVPRSITTSRSVEIGMDCLEHIRITGRELLPPDVADRIDFLPVMERERLLWERFDLESAGMRRLIDLLAESRVFLDPTLIVDAAVVARLYDGVTVPLDRRLSASLRETVANLDMRAIPRYRVPDEAIPSAQAGFQRRLDFIGMCHQAGVRLLAGTDTVGPGPMLPGVGLHEELALLVRAGLSPADAVRAATITAAEALGRESELGTVEVGKRADLVMLEADPLADIGNVRRVRAVVHGGRFDQVEDLVDMVAHDSGDADQLKASAGGT
jgi:imidazolonepropionase-like amidohydrolase